MFLKVTTLNKLGEIKSTALLNADDISVIRNNGDKGCIIFLRSDQEDTLKVVEDMQYFRDYLK